MKIAAVSVARFGVCVVLVLLCVVWPVSGRRCSSVEFQCDNGECIPLWWHCDGGDDCGDNSDEDAQVCHMKGLGSCGSKEFRCNNSKCIDVRWRCDGEDDCLDNSDEDDSLCASVQCGENEFACGNPAGQCVPLYWLCDGHMDCRDGSDELNCSQPCPDSEFSCGNNTCIMKSWVCDGERDCADGRDEVNCSKVCDLSRQMRCGSGDCVDLSTRCDGDPDCVDGSDELGCLDSTTPGDVCGPGKVMCSDHSTCILERWQCDGDEDCNDGSDEAPDICHVMECSEEQFQCDLAGECVALHKVCDGVEDCRGGKDEQQCNHQCGAGQFQCEVGSCVATSAVCDGRTDCPDGSDEGSRCYRPLDMCSVVQFHDGCQHKCVKTAAGFQCVCLPGYRINPDRSSCSDIDECQGYGRCSQLCVNTHGHYKCECLSGYSLTAGPSAYCKADQGPLTLLLAHRSDIRVYDVHSRETRSIVTNTAADSDMDFDYNSSSIFWSDLKRSSVFRTPIHGETWKQSSVVLAGVFCHSLSLDWLNNHLYMIVGRGAENRRLVVANINDNNNNINNNKLATLIAENLQDPRSIRLDPVEGWMYWSDVGRMVIERAGMDGSRRQTVVKSSSPVSLTLDLLTRRLFWLDSKLQLIQSCDLDGGRKRVVSSDAAQLPHLFSLAVFEDTVFWSDVSRESIMQTNKFGGSEILPLTSQGQADYGVRMRVMHPYLQRANINSSFSSGGEIVSPCRPFNGGCSHLCVPRPSLAVAQHEDSTKLASDAVSACVCPDGLWLDASRKRCTISPRAPPRIHDHHDAAAHPQLPPAIASVDSDRGVSASVVAAVVFGSLFVILCILLLLAVLVYRYYGRGFRQLNVDNPIYKKTTVRSVKLDRVHSPFSNSPTDESLQPLTRSQEEL